MANKDSFLKGVLILIAIALVGFGAVSLFNSFEAEENRAESNIREADFAEQTGVLKEFTIEASNWKFEPDTITVNLGDSVRITAKSLDLPHGFAIAEYGISEYLDGSNPTIIEFVADKPGTFFFYCNVPCGSGHGRMRGRLIVK